MSSGARSPIAVWSRHGRKSNCCGGYAGDCVGKCSTREWVELEWASEFASCDGGRLSCGTLAGVIGCEVGLLGSCLVND